MVSLLAELHLLIKIILLKRCKKKRLTSLGDHLCTCTTHSGDKKTHDWSVDQLADLFRTTHNVKTQQAVKSRGQHCGDIELAGYLANAAVPVPHI